MLELGRAEQRLVAGCLAVAAGGLLLLIGLGMAGIALVGRQVRREPGRRPAPRMILESDTVNGSKFHLALGEHRVSVGRGAGNRLRIGALFAGCESVSRAHAVLEPISGGWVVRDLGSANGTTVDGRRVRCGLLRDGQVLGFGAVRFRVRAGDPVDDRDRELRQGG